MLSEIWWHIVSYGMLVLGASIVTLFAVGTAILIHQRWKERRMR